MGRFVLSQQNEPSSGDVTTPSRNLRIDPATRAPRTDEYSVGVDREVGRKLALAIAYVHKKGAGFIGWEDTGGAYRAETRTLTDGRLVPSSHSSTPRRTAGSC